MENDKDPILHLWFNSITLLQRKGEKSPARENRVMDINIAGDEPEGEEGASCRRCGTCCKKGGPALHAEDRILVEKGWVPLASLFTIRQGEPFFDNIRGGIHPATTDIIKIKNRDRQCSFYKIAEKSCDIYEHRPLECRALQCWDTAEIERVYADSRLTRKDLLDGVEGLWDLVCDHQRRCPYEKLYAYRKGDGGGNRELEKVVLEMIRYDDSLRNLVVRKTAMQEEMLEFLLGRPLIDTIRMFGLRLGKDGSRLRLISDAV